MATATKRDRIIIIVASDRRLFDHFDHVGSQTKRVTFSMAIGKWELMHECSPKHSNGNSKNEIREIKDEEGKKRRLSV